jgi:citrate synthase
MLSLINNYDPLLYSLFIEAHEESAIQNENASLHSLLNAGLTTGRLENGLAAAIMTLGGHHAPISEARTVYLTWTKEFIDTAVLAKMFIPGFGNSFYKDSIDPKWEKVAAHIKEFYPQHDARITEITQWLADNNLKLFPNAAMYSAVVCEILAVVPGTEVALLIMARLPAWSLAWANKNDSFRLIKL